MGALAVTRRMFYLWISLFFLLELVTGVPGGWKTADPEDESVQKIAKFAVEQLDRETNSLFVAQLVKITKAETQIVAGVNYRLTLDIGLTGCRKNEVHLPSSCQANQRQTCTLVVWDRPWLDNNMELTESKCNPFELVDSHTESEDVPKEAASFAVSSLQSMAKGLYRIHLNHIIESKQTEARKLYKMKLSCDLESCLSTKFIDDCKDDIKKETVICHVEVKEQLGDSRHVLKSYKCDKEQYKEKKSIQVLENLEAFETFKKNHRKQYHDMGEESWRFNIFEENLSKIKFLQDHELGTATYGVTQFADLTAEEFRKYYLTPVWDKSEDHRLAPAEIPKVDLPTDYDWRHYNAVTAVKNQGSCGSCWAFSVTGNIEGQWAIQKKNLVSLSEQELVDCDKLDEGCNGGLPSNAYQEIQRLGGLETEKDYPYEGKDDTCHLVKQELRVYINGSLNISKDENDMAAWVYKNGPVSIGINAFAMQFYFGGVSHPWRIFCSPDFLDHGVLIAGFGVHKGIFGDTPYWLVKNSWGTFWGEKGYYLVYRGDGTCGLNEMVSSAVVK